MVSDVNKITATVARGEGGLGRMVHDPKVYDDASPAVWPIARLSIDAHLEKLELIEERKGVDDHRRAQARNRGSVVHRVFVSTSPWSR